MQLLAATWIVNLLLGCLYLQVNTKPPIPVHKLSNVEHHPHGGGHNVRFDHEALLGKEEAEKFDKLSSEESSAKLSEIFDKIDVTDNGFLSKNEMTEWIKRIHDKHIEHESMKEYKDYGGLEDRLSYEQYIKEAQPDESHVYAEDLDEYYRQKEKSRTKWEAADLDNDGNLSLREFMAFANPLHFEHMHDFYVKAAPSISGQNMALQREKCVWPVPCQIINMILLRKNVTLQDTLKGMDKDGDGVVTNEEYMRSRWTPKSEGEEPPEWLKDEAETMSKNFDVNSDGQFDLVEFRNWLIPPLHDPFEAETIHLFAHADNNKDDRLSREEVLNNHELFVGSQATAYGQVWKYHQEL